ncbi:hypothetical protein [Streptosporangium sp. NPDC049644]|uniref:hypothetical protein n=1 Tax=Streptosporangium sp. NPDC049644 TaxID=3155507 RepID=UPI003420D57B
MTIAPARTRAAVVEAMVPMPHERGLDGVGDGEPEVRTSAAARRQVEAGHPQRKRSCDHL